MCFLSLPCAAAEEANIVLENTHANRGDTVELALSISDNPGIALLSLTFVYEKEVLSLSDNSNESNGDILPTLDIGRNFIFSADENCNGNGLLATLKFKVDPSATAGIYPVTVIVNEAYNDSFEPVTLTKADGSITVNISDIEADVTEPPPPYIPPTPVTTKKVTVTEPLPTTTAPTAPVTFVTTVAKPVTEPIVYPAVTTTVAITTVSPTATEPTVTQPVIVTAPADTEPSSPVTQKPAQENTEAIPSATQPVSDNEQGDKSGSPAPVIAAACIAAVAVAAIIIFFVRKRR